MGGNQEQVGEDQEQVGEDQDLVEEDQDPVEEDQDLDQEAVTVLVEEDLMTKIKDLFLSCLS